MIPNAKSSLWDWVEFYVGRWKAAPIPLAEGKRPMVGWLEYQHEMPPRKVLGDWFIQKKPWGMALICGAVSDHLVRLDLDEPGYYIELMAKGLFPKEAPAFRSQRKGGGHGVILRSTVPVPKIPEGKFKGYPAMGIQGQGSITVLPPTPGYEWITDYAEVPRLDFMERLDSVLGYRPEIRERLASGDTAGDDRLADLLENTREPGRRNAVVAITNMLRSRRFGVDSIKMIIRPHFEEWGQTDIPLTWETIERLIESSYERYAHEGARYGLGTTAPQALRAPGSSDEVEVKRYRPTVRRTEQRAEDYTVQGLVQAGHAANVFLAAFTGTGKTTVCIGIAIQMAQGSDVWGLYPTKKPLRIAYIDQEDVEEQIRDTVEQLEEVFGYPDPDNFQVIAAEGRHFDVTNPESLEKLEAELDEVRPEFVFLDGWQWMVHGDPNNKEYTNVALEWWKRIRAKYGCGLWIIHHTRKIGAPQFRPANPLEMASGAQEAMNQARTKLIFEHLTGDFEDYSFMHGTSGKSQWNPLRIVLEYDATTNTHRLITREEADELFDAEIVMEIWGERKGVRRIVGLLNRLKRLGHSDRDIAGYLGISHTAVSKWRTGKNAPSDAKLEELAKWLKDQDRPVTSGPKTRTLQSHSGCQQVATEPKRIQDMPSPDKGAIHRYNNNIETNAPSQCGEDAEFSPGKKPLETCAKCPLFGQPYVGGRGGGAGATMLVGDGPGETDAKSGRAFSGLNEKRLGKMLKTARIDPLLCRYTHAVRCHVKKSRKPTKKAVDLCRPLLERELAEIRPKTIFALGEVAFAAFYPGKLKSYHGVKIVTENYTLMATYKPDAFEHSPETLAMAVEDFAGFKDRPKMRRLEGDYSVAVLDHYVLASKKAAMDIETTGLEMNSEVLGMSVCEAPGEAVYLPGDEVVPFLKANPSSNVVFHNAKFDTGVLMSNGAPRGVFSDMDDTMTLAYVMNRRHLGLKDLALHELGLEMTRFEDVAGKGSLIGKSVEEIAPYCCGDSDGTLRLWDRLWGQADSRQRRLYREVERPLPLILAEMQIRGVCVDVPYLERLGAKMGAELKDLELRMEKQHGLTVEVLNSPQQLGGFVYDKLGLKATKYTDTGQASTDKYALEKLEGQHSVLDLILQYRRLAVLKKTFVDGALRLQRNGLVFPTLNQIGTTTGRMSGSEPNMQNLPTREDKTIRRGYVAPEGYVVASFDNSQVDLRTLAYLSKDPAMNEIFDRDGDIHTETADDPAMEAIHGRPVAEQRRIAKTANFLVVFGGGYMTLAAKTGIPEGQAMGFMGGYETKYERAFAWIRELHKQAERDGFVETHMGRRRYIPKLFSPNPKKRGEARREAQNGPVQGGSSDILKQQMAAVTEVALPFTQIHDELDFYLLEDSLRDTIPRIKERMENVDCPFKLKVDVKVGPNMGDMKEWKDAQTS